MSDPVETITPTAVEESRTPDDPCTQDIGAEDIGAEGAVVDLLGVLAYGELVAVSRLAADADLAPGLAARSELARLSAIEFAHFESIRRRLEELGRDVTLVMEPFVPALDAFHARTAPSSWLESLVKAYVGDGLASDFFREISAFLDPATHRLVTEVLASEGHAQLVVREVTGAIEDDPRVAGRLALWGRRLVGEALSQAQQVAAEHESLATLIVGGPGRPGADLAQIVQLFGRLTESHTRRMSRLGLSA
jgi:hypothetical protein